MKRVIGLLLVLAALGGIGFYVLKKYLPNLVPPSKNIKQYLPLNSDTQSPFTLPTTKTLSVYFDLKGEMPRVLAFDNKGILFTSTFIKNYLSHFSPNFLFISGDDNLRHHLENNGMLPLFYLPISLIGLYFVLKTIDKRKSLLMIWLAIAAVPAVPVFPSPHAIRSGLMIIPLIFFWKTKR